MERHIARAGLAVPLSPSAQEAILPRVLPAGWLRHPQDPRCFDCHGQGALRGLRVLAEASLEEDGRAWLHVSASRASRCPSWEDMDAVKRLFIGDDRVAYQVHPPRSEHFSAPSYLRAGPRVGTVLHLWAPLEGEPPLPNFLRARGGEL